MQAHKTIASLVIVELYVTIKQTGVGFDDTHLSASTLEAEAGETLGSRPILSTYQFPVQSDYIVKPCL